MLLPPLELAGIQNRWQVKRRPRLALRCAVIARAPVVSIVFLTCFLGHLPCVSATANAGVLIIRGGAVVDLESDGPPVIRDILVRDERIAAVRRHVRAPRGAANVDARGKYLIPGLWDSHAHLNALTEVGPAPERYVGYGVLSVRDMGGSLDALLLLRDSIRHSERVGPNLFIAGPTLNGQQSAPFHRLVVAPEAGRAAVRELASSGVDYIKIHRRVSRPVFYSVLAEARRYGLDVVGHVPLSMSWVEAADAHMRSMEHIFTILENELSSEGASAARIDAALARIDGPRGDIIFASMARAGAYLCPTLVAFERTIDTPPELADAKRDGFAHFLKCVARARRAGVTIVAGTDVSEPAGAGAPASIREIELLVKSGLSPREALQAATTAPARLLRRPELSAIRPGAQASLLVLDADPTVDVANLRRLSAVILRGRVIGPEELARLRSGSIRPTGPRRNRDDEFRRGDSGNRCPADRSSAGIRSRHSCSSRARAFPPTPSS